ncbi:hypothetical protein COZ73_04320, partial [Candidatus Falkowbacteria bacterium CG_4_8_14_3_um_filter_36_11]
SQMEKEGFGEEFSICSSFCFGEIRGGIFGGTIEKRIEIWYIVHMRFNHTYIIIPYKRIVNNY